MRVRHAYFVAGLHCVVSCTKLGGTVACTQILLKAQGAKKTIRLEEADFFLKFALFSVLNPARKVWVL